jgi:hypothetical protein
MGWDGVGWGGGRRCNLSRAEPGRGCAAASALCERGPRGLGGRACGRGPGQGGGGSSPPTPPQAQRAAGRLGARRAGGRPSARPGGPAGGDERCASARAPSAGAARAGRGAPRPGSCGAAASAASGAGPRGGGECRAPGDERVSPGHTAPRALVASGPTPALAAGGSVGRRVELSGVAGRWGRSFIAHPSGVSPSRRAGPCSLAAAVAALRRGWGLSGDLRAPRSFLPGGSAAPPPSPVPPGLLQAAPGSWAGGTVGTLRPAWRRLEGKARTSRGHADPVPAHPGPKVEDGALDPGLPSAAQALYG